MDIAINTLKDKSHQCFVFFILQLLFFHASSFLLMWILYSKIVAVIINIILAIFLFAFVKNGVELIGLLYVSDEDATSNSFD